MHYHWWCACFSDWREELRHLSSSIDTHAPVPTSNMINVVRATEFECFKRAFRRTNFDSKKRLDVRFVDADENTEGAPTMAVRHRSICGFCCSTYSTPARYLKGVPTAKNSDCLPEVSSIWEWFFCFHVTCEMNDIGLCNVVAYNWTSSHVLNTTSPVTIFS